MLKISLLFKKFTNFTGKYLENSQDKECENFRVLFSYKHKQTGRLSNLHQCTINLRILGCFLYLYTAAMIGSSNINALFDKFCSIRIFISLTILLKQLLNTSTHFWSFIINFSFLDNVILILASELLEKSGATVFQNIFLPVTDFMSKVSK